MSVILTEPVLLDPSSLINFPPQTFLLTAGTEQAHYFGKYVYNRQWNTAIVFDQDETYFLIGNNLALRSFSMKIHCASLIC